MRLQETKTISLSGWILLFYLQLLLQGHIFVFLLLEPGHVQPTDLRCRYFVELAKDLVAHERGVAYFGDQAAELEFDEVVNLLLADVLHNALMLIINSLSFLF